jgi:hypothetical protein
VERPRAALLALPMVRWVFSRVRNALTIRSVADDLGLNPEKLRNRVRAADGRHPGAATGRPATPPAAAHSVEAEPDRFLPELRRVFARTFYVLLPRFLIGAVLSGPCPETSRHLRSSGASPSDRPGGPDEVERNMPRLVGRERVIAFR